MPAATGTSGPSVEVTRLRKSFPISRSWRERLSAPRNAQYRTVVQDVSFTADRAEIVGLLGPNGAGKTTLLKMLSTLILPDSGSATIAGHDLIKDPAGVRQVLSPVIADERSLDWRLSAAENLFFYGSLQGFHGRALHERADAMLAAVQLTDVGGKLVGSFSSGMKQRLLIARALLSTPEVLLLDEPTRSLDPLAARTFRSFLRTDIVRRHGCTVLLATHDPDEAFDLCDRLAILHQGRFLAIGSSHELAARFSERRFQLWTSNPDHPAIAALTARSISATLLPPQSEDGIRWEVMELRFVADEPAPHDVLRHLIESGVVAARFEKVKPNLADLIDAVVGVSTAPDA